MNKGREKEINIIWELTSNEQSALATLLLGHGKGKAAANKIRVHRLTIKRIADTGRGYKQNIQKVRKKLLEPIGIYQSTKDNNAGIQQESGLGKVIA